jgi:hypothetical protein
MEATRDGGSDDDPGRQRRPRTAVATGWRRPRMAAWTTTVISDGDDGEPGRRRR